MAKEKHFRVEVKMCNRCRTKLPITDFKPGSKFCKMCVADDRCSHRTAEKGKKHKKDGLTELDRIAIKCQELGISYGEYQQRERNGQL